MKAASSKRIDARLKTTVTARRDGIFFKPFKRKTFAMDETENPEMTDVESSNVASVGYNSSSQELFIKFKDGSVWKYAGVPQDKATGIMTAESVGKYYHAGIKGVYDASRVDNVPPVPESAEQEAGQEEAPASTEEEVVSESPEAVDARPTEGAAAPVVDSNGNPHPMEAAQAVDGEIIDSDPLGCNEEAPAVQGVANNIADAAEQPEVPTEAPDAPLTDDSALAVQAWSHSATEGLTVTLINGSVFNYPDAPRELVEGLGNAGNPTRYYQAQIIPHYEGKLAA